MTVIVYELMMTMLLAISMMFMESGKHASRNPEWEAFNLQKDINNRFAAPFHQSEFIIEARNGDILTQTPLRELYQNSQR